MHENELELTIEELADRVGVPVRTIRFYIAEGLLQGPGARGKAATYGEEQLLRLRLIRRLSEQRVPLAEMRGMLARLSLDEVRALLAEEDQRAAELERAVQVPSPREYIATLLNRARQPTSAKESSAVYPPSPPGSTPGTHQQQSPGPYPKRAAEVWHRWELAPGVELHVKASAQHQYRTLIEQLLKIAKGPEN